MRCDVAVRAAGPGDPRQQRDRRAGAADAGASPRRRAPAASACRPRRDWWSRRCSCCWCCRRCSRCSAGGCSGRSSRRSGAKPLTDSGIWHRVADGGGPQTRPRRGRWRSPGWRCCAPACSPRPVGLSQTEQFRVQAESVSGYDTLAAHFPSGLTDPDPRHRTDATAPPTSSSAITDTPGVVSATPAGAVARRADPVVGRPRRRARLRRGVRNH